MEHKYKHNDFISSSNITLDIVYTYVNTTDEKWLKKVKSYKPTFGDELNKQRFNYFGEIIFSLQTVQEFMPWINNIFIIHDDQVFDTSFLKPEFRNKIKFINHKEIIPEKYLPVFNSMLIELFISEIPNLSDYFIYLNDDLFIGDYLSQSFFFDKDRVFKQYIFDNNKPYDLNRLQGEPHLIRLINVHNIVKKVLKKNKYYRSMHGGWHLNKYILKLTFKLFKNIWLKMLKTQKFRTYNEDTYEFLTLSSIMAEHYKISKTITSCKKIFTLQKPLNDKFYNLLIRIKPYYFTINNLDESQKKWWLLLTKNYIKKYSNNKYNTFVKNIKYLLH